MANKPTKIVYTDNDRAIVNALKGTEGMTLAQLSESIGRELKPGHIVSAIKKGLVASIGETEVTHAGKHNVTLYTFVDADVHTKENGDPCNYTDNEKNLLSFAGRMEGAFTLAQLAEAMGVEKLSSGSINGLVKKGNIAKGDKISVPSVNKTSVKIYGFVADIPADAE